MPLTVAELQSQRWEASWCIDPPLSDDPSRYQCCRRDIKGGVPAADTVSRHPLAPDKKHLRVWSLFEDNLVSGREREVHSAHRGSDVERNVVVLCDDCKLVRTCEQDGKTMNTAATLYIIEITLALTT